MLTAGELELDRLKGHFQDKPLFSDFFPVWLSGGFCGPMLALVRFGWAPHGPQVLQSHRAAGCAVPQPKH